MGRLTFRVRSLGRYGREVGFIVFSPRTRRAARVSVGPSACPVDLGSARRALDPAFAGRAAGENHPSWSGGGSAVVSDLLALACSNKGRLDC
jgi:hypothetical protein